MRGTAIFALCGYGIYLSPYLYGFYFFWLLR